RASAGAWGAPGAGGKTAETTSQARRGSPLGESVSPRPAAAPSQGRLSARTCRHPAVVRAVPAGCFLFRPTCGIPCVPQGITVCGPRPENALLTHGRMAMTFDEILAQVLDLLQREQRLSYRALKVRFALDDDHLEALKEEIIEAKQLAVDEHGKVRVWTGSGASPPTPAPSSERAPRTYTSPYLAEKILISRSALEG